MHLFYEKCMCALRSGLFFLDWIFWGPLLGGHRSDDGGWGAGQQVQRQRSEVALVFFSPGLLHHIS